MTFFDGTNVIGTALTAGGVASFFTSVLSVGSHSITATYLGDSNFASSTAAVLTQKVQTSAQATNSLINTVNGMNLDQGIANSADAKLNASISSLNSGNNNAAKNQLNAFINEVNAQAGKKITQDQAAQLIKAAQNIINSIH